MPLPTPPPALKAQAKQLVADWWKSANTRDVQVVNSAEFVRGWLFTVEIIDANGEAHYNYVYGKGDAITRFDSLDALVVQIGKISTLWDGFVGMFQMSAMIAIIGLAATVMMLILVYHGDSQAKQALIQAFGMIVGFYTGTKVSAGRKPRI